MGALKEISVLEAEKKKLKASERKAREMEKRRLAGLELYLRYNS